MAAHIGKFAMTLGALLVSGQLFAHSHGHQMTEAEQKAANGVFADKDVKGIAELLAKEFPEVAVTQTDNDRAMDAEELAELYKAFGANVVAVYRNVPEAVDALREKGFVACGTISLAGEVAAQFSDALVK